MDPHAHDRRRFLALSAALAAAPVLSACGAGFGGDDDKGDGSAADDVTKVLGRAVEVTVRLGEQHVSLVAPRADATGLRPDDPVRLTVRPENLLLFEADRPERPGRRIGKR